MHHSTFRSPIFLSIIYQNITFIPCFLLCFVSEIAIFADCTSYIPVLSWQKIIFKLFEILWVRVRVMVFNATFNNISVTSWQSVLLVELTWVPWENHWPVASHWQTLYYDIGSCKSNYHTITTTTTPEMLWSVCKLTNI